MWVILSLRAASCELLATLMHEVRCAQKCELAKPVRSTREGWVKLGVGLVRNNHERRFSLDNGCNHLRTAARKAILGREGTTLLLLIIVAQPLSRNR